MIPEAHISLQSFLLGLGVLSYLVASCGGLGLLGVWLGHHIWAYCGVFYISVNLLLVLVYRGAEWQVGFTPVIPGVGQGVYKGMDNTAFLLSN